VSRLEFELFVLKRIVEAAEDSYLSPLALWRLELACARILSEHVVERQAQ